MNSPISIKLLAEAYERAKNPSVVYQNLRIILEQDPYDWFSLSPELRQDAQAKDVFLSVTENSPDPLKQQAYLHFQVNSANLDNPKIRAKVTQIACQLLEANDVLPRHLDEQIRSLPAVQSIITKLEEKRLERDKRCANINWELPFNSKAIA